MNILYQSSDGKIFETSSECTKHERNIAMAIICPNCGRENTRVEMKVTLHPTPIDYRYYYVCSECGYKTDTYNDLYFAKKQWVDDKSKFGVRDYSNTNLLPTELTTSTTSGYITNYPSEPTKDYTTTTITCGTGSEPTYIIAKEDNEVPTEIRTNDNFDKKEYKKIYKQAKRNTKATRKDLMKLVKKYDPYDYYHLHKIVMTIINNMWFTYRFNRGVYQEDESRNRIADELWEVMTLDSKIEGIQVDFDPDPKLEPELYKKLYSKIGEHIMEWWD